MLRIILYRLGLAVVLLLTVTAITFGLTAIAPGDPVATILGTGATPELVAEMRARLGFDDPIVLQYVHWLQGAVVGNFGESMVTSQPVIEAIGDRLPTTLSLVLLATGVAAFVGIALGMISAIRGGPIGRATDVLAVGGFVIPNFWLGLMLVLFFSVQLAWLPATGYVPLTDDPAGWLRSLILPVIAVSLLGVTAIAKQTRDAMRQVMGAEFITVLRADGFSERRIMFSHALRNAAIPIVTGTGVLFIGMFGGTVLVETVFVLPGIGSLAVSAARSGDIILLQGVAVVFCIVVIVANLIVDLIYGWLNPKVRAQ